MIFRRLMTVVALCAMSLAAPCAARAAGPPPLHPAVVRIMAAENGGASFGSGSLVAVSQRYGLVITNWHVVRDTNGFIVVSFPDGFRSSATIVRIDRDWDLAALAIWRPNTTPVALAQQPPQPGDWLTIAGYGQGSFRMSAGRCTQYLSPGGRLPHEMVEVSTPARQGDSGGPILNQRGELAGVLFGTGGGRTMGSYCGRVQSFVDPLLRQMDAMDQASPPAVPGNTLLAQTPAARESTVPVATPWPGMASTDTSKPPPMVPVAPRPAIAAQRDANPPPVAASVDLAGSDRRVRPSLAAANTPWQPAPPQSTGNREPNNANPATNQTVSLGQNSGVAAPQGRFDGLISFLAIAGAILLAFHGLRLLGRAVG